MNIQYRHQTYTVDPCSLLLRGDSFYAKITLAARVEMTVYVKVDPCLTGMVYTCAEPPKALTVVLTPEMAANVNASALVQIVVRKPAPVISLWSKWFEVAA